MSLTLSKPSLEQLWIQAGGRPSAANLAASIALAESSGNPQATNQNANGTTDRGLWQINSVHGQLSTYDELANARAAVAISNNGANWSPWTTYNTGAYLTYFTGTGASSSSTPGSGGGASTGTGGQSSRYGGLGGFLLKAVMTIGLVGAGLGLSAVGAKGALGKA